MKERFQDQPVWKSLNAEGLSIDAGLRAYMINVYKYMGLGLGLTGLVSYLTAQSPELLQAIFGSPLKWLIMFAPLGIVFFLSARLHSLSLSTTQMVFWGYSGLMGLSLSSLFILFTLPSIAQLFFVTASLFGFMSLYGYTTQKDLTSMGSFMFMGVVGIVIAGLFNLFFQNSVLQMIISIVGVIVFTGLTAYDTQAIKESYLEGESSEISGKKAIMGALQLYLDFINLFVSLLRLFGDRR